MTHFMKNLANKIQSHQGLIRLKSHQKNSVAAIVVGLTFIIGSLYLLLGPMKLTEVLEEAPGLFKYFGETYIYFFFLGLGGFLLFVFGVFRLIRPKRY